jgi:hypothetical protein
MVVMARISLEIVPATANGNDPVPAYRQLARVLL